MHRTLGNAVDVGGRRARTAAQLDHRHKGRAINIGHYLQHCRLNPSANAEALFQF